MTIKELTALETETIDGLRIRAQAGDNEAAEVLLNYLQTVSTNIEKWKNNKEKKES